MKKLLSIFIAYVLLVSFFSSPMAAYAACVPPLSIQAPGGYPYMQSFDTGVNNSCFIYILDKSGNLSVAGNDTTLGMTIYTPATITGIVTAATITPTATYNLLASTGTMSPVGISTSGFANGSFIILSSTSDVAQVTITSGTSSGTGVGLAAATRVLGVKSKLGLIFDSAANIWRELFYSAD